jgi:ArsR family transcriptional regulator, virulence genes transcriptional regulator
MMNTNVESLVVEQAEIHQVFSNPRRLLILRMLDAQEMSVGEIAERIGASLQNTSQHLRLMKDKGVLEARREGQTIFYQIAGNVTGKNCRLMLHVFNNKN